MSYYLLAATALILSGLVAPSPIGANEEEPGWVETQGPAPEGGLVDLGILVFDPGLPDDASELRKLEAQGTFAEVRESEAVYIPVHLERTLQRTGFWGAVRLIPRAGTVDVTVSGTILTSNGNQLRLEVRAVDSRGNIWLDKRYKEKADASIYLREDGTDDPFQHLYDRIANDLLSKFKRLGEDDIETIDATTRLRFAADLTPVAFSKYLEVRKESYSITRLPTRDDPMMARVERLRQRDRMFIDLLDEHYGDFYQEMQDPYRGWRAQDYWEREGWKNLGEGSPRGGSPVGIVPTGDALPWDGTGVICGTPGIFGGFEGGRGSKEALREAQARKKSHLRELRELGVSLASDMAPLLVELEGRVHRLAGSVERQYASWRQLLREIFVAETGLPLVSETAEPNSY